jgi:hypothetical protein
VSIAPPLVSIPVGVVVERVKGMNQWTDFTWRPVSAIAGVQKEKAWTVLKEDGERTTFFAGAAEIELHRTETPNYLSNLESGEPMVWVALRQAAADPPYEVFMVTADPAEGEALTEAGNDIVQPVPMPASVVQRLAAFIAEHHVEHAFTKRKRDRADLEALARRGPSLDEDGK